MAFLKKYAFQIAISCLVVLMGFYLLYTYILKPEAVPSVKDPAPNFTLNDLDNNPVTLDSTDGKVRLVYFYFASCPDVCPPTTFLISQVQEILKEKGDLGTEVEIISITFDPVTDTPEVITNFANKVGVDFDHWTFLRGETSEEMIQLAREFSVAVMYDEEAKTFYHNNPLILVDQDGNIREWINASPNLEAGDKELTAEDVYKSLKKLY
ncbi:SCO family protein [Paenibacillus endoradicis]|uniref:SCO family protein n=1 Tax=Paenibacillus endoradicis TaxID=2972487 RepID=UPI0021593DBB|nr:SCO family protein [Paenibacillus endoradicis]MCR8659491.1 SCO family protein [Paenibacillus endoradicis]